MKVQRVRKSHTSAQNIGHKVKMHLTKSWGDHVVVPGLGAQCDLFTDLVFSVVSSQDNISQWDLSNYQQLGVALQIDTMKLDNLHYELTGSWNDIRTRLQRQALQTVRTAHPTRDKIMRRYIAAGLPAAFFDLGIRQASAATYGTAVAMSHDR